MQQVVKISIDNVVIPKIILMKFGILIILILAGTVCYGLDQKEVDPFPGENWKTGYIEVGDGSYLFYYLFRCRNSSIINPPLVIWLEGGPGISTALGVWGEGGPYIVNNKTMEIEWNPYAWNNISDVLFVDQPAGTHFSYAKKDTRICKDEGCVANDFYKFTLGFFDKFPEYKGRPLYVSGISYGGHYVPAIAGRFLKENNKDINLKGIGIANGLIDIYKQMPSYPEFLYRLDFINVFQYIIYHATVVTCRLANVLNMQEYDYPCGSSFKWSLAQFNILNDPYDMSGPEFPFKPVMSKLIPYLNQPEIQHALGVNQSFAPSNTTVYDKLKDDIKLNLSPELQLCLEKGIKVNLFFGDIDYVCNYIGGEWVADSLEWSGRSEFLKQAYKQWTMNGVAKGKVRRYKNLALTVIYGAGHSIFFKHREFAFEILRDLLEPW